MFILGTVEEEASFQVMILHYGHEHFAFTNIAVKYGVVFYNKVGYNKINRKANESCKQGAETYAEYQTYI